MTDREKLIELLLEIDSVCDGSDCCECCPEGCYTHRAADHLIANGVTFATDTNDGGKWISVEDRLPEEGEVVMCRHKAHEHPVFCQWDESDLCWENDSWTFGRGLITHWMPMPEPPKEDNDG